MRHATALLIFGLLTAAPACAQSGGVGSRAHWAVSAGLFDLFGNTTLYEGGFEHRFRPRVFGLVPAAGLTLHSDKGGYVHGGLRRDFRLGGRWVATPHGAVLLFENGDAKDLGQTLEFRVGVEIGYGLPGGSRLSLSLYHISNADLSRINPGSESLVLVYGF